MKRENLYSSFFLLISTLLFFFFIYPKMSSISELNSKIFQKKSELETSDRYFKEILETLEKLKNYQDSILKIETSLPNDSDIPSVFNFIQKSSSQAGLLLENISSVNSSQEGNLKKWTTTLKLKGDYSSFKKFLSILEKSARLIKVDKFSLLAEEKGLSFDLTISFFSY
jgi:Tfp pilus assembly protein PilO